MSINAAIAAPVEHQCGGKGYRFARLSLEDWAAYCEHIQATRLSQISALDLPPKEKQQLYREVVREAIVNAVAHRRFPVLAPVQGAVDAPNELPTLGATGHRAIERSYAGFRVCAAGKRVHLARR